MSGVRVVPILLAVAVLLAIAVWARDVRAAFLGFVLLGVVSLALRRPAPDEAGPPIPTHPRPSAHIGSKRDDVATAATATFMVVAAVVGGVVAWIGTQKVLTTLVGVVVFAAVAAMLAGVAGIVASALGRGDDSP